MERGGRGHLHAVKLWLHVKAHEEAEREASRKSPAKGHPPRGGKALPGALIDQRDGQGKDALDRAGGKSRNDDFPDDPMRSRHGLVDDPLEEAEAGDDEGKKNDAAQEAFAPAGPKLGAWPDGGPSHDAAHDKRHGGHEDQGGKGFAQVEDEGLAEFCGGHGVKNG